jgi:alpha-N-arabinofuranosidase
VNPLGTPQDLRLEIKGAGSVASEGESVIMKADSPADTNSLAEPRKIVPVPARESGFGARFTRTLAPYSINILKISTRP